MKLVVFMTVENRDQVVRILSGEFCQAKLAVNANELISPEARIVVTLLFAPSIQSDRLPLIYTEPWPFLFLDRDVMVLVVKTEASNKAIVVRYVPYALDLDQDLERDDCMWHESCDGVILKEGVQTKEQWKRTKRRGGRLEVPRHRVLEEATHENISKAEVHRSSVAAVLMLDAAAYAAGEQPSLGRLRHGSSVLCFMIDSMMPQRIRRSRSRRTIGFGMNCEE